MSDPHSSLEKRIKTIWKEPDFASFFEKTVKKKPHNMRNGSILFSDGDELSRLYFIKSGYVKLYRLSEDGKESISYLYGPGYVVGLRALLSKGEIAKHSAEALTDLVVISISHSEYFAAIAKYPEFLIDLAHYCLDRLEYTERTIETFVVTDTTARVAYFLSDVANRFCKNQKAPITLPIKLTHQRIAEFVGSIRETITIAMQRLEKAGCIKVQRGIVTIIDMKKLTRYALLERKTTHK